MRDVIAGRLLGLLAIGVLAAACGGSSDDGGDGDGDGDGGGFESIVVEPPQVTVTVAPGGSTTQAYVVYGVAGGVRTDITAQCALTLDPAFGTISGATAIIGPRGGATQVAATCATLRGTSDLIVNLASTVVMPGTPSDAPALFGAATAGTDPTRTPTIEYPLNRAVSPVNIPPIEAQWTAAGNDLFHVRLTSAYVAIDVYTVDREAMLEAEAWEDVATSAAGGDLKVEVEGLLRSAPATRFAAAPVSIVMSHDAIDKTAIYYWASSAGSIMNQTFGSTTAPTTVRDQCTSCHSLSRAGTRLGYSRCVNNDCGQQFVGFLRYDAPTSTWVEAFDANDRVLRGSYTTFSPVGNPFPTDERSLAIVTRGDGTLGLYDPDTGAEVASNLSEVSTHGAGAPRSAMMADWSADGTKVAFASPPRANRSVDLDNGVIATMTYQYTGGQHVFGEPVPIVADPISLPGGTYKNFFFPSFSNDGALILFNAARAEWRNFSNAASPGQRLMLAASDGTWVKDLTALNGGTVDSDITWPHWAPGEHRDYYWFVFSSQRDYGHRVTLGNTNQACIGNGVRQCKQIWIGAVSKAALMSGQADPSAPPMWLPGQDPRTNNISPFWTAGIGID